MPMATEKTNPTTCALVGGGAINSIMALYAIAIRLIAAVSAKGTSAAMRAKGKRQTILIAMIANALEKSALNVKCSLSALNKPLTANAIRSPAIKYTLV